jgi:predicted DNA-binding transcriptional regulator AlpA
MSITIIQILQAMLSEDGYIAVLRGPTRHYKEHISVSRADGRAMRNRLVFSRPQLNDLMGANFVSQDGPENENRITIFKLTDQGKEIAKLSLLPRDSRLKAFLKDKLLDSGYPWPDNLEGKSVAWLKSEIEAIKRLDGAKDQVS